MAMLSSCTSWCAGPEEKLAALGIELPKPATAIANYRSAVRTGNLLVLAGHLPRRPDGTLVTGKLGGDLEVRDGYEAARFCAVALLATLKAEVGDLAKVKRIVRLAGLVNATSDFEDHSKVINGASDLLVEIFGDAGRHARLAAGMSSLPLGAAVEIEMMVELAD